MVPAALIQYPYSVVVLPVRPVKTGIVFLAVEHSFSKSHHQTAGRSENIHHALGPSDIEARVIVNPARADALAAVHVSRLVGHLRSRGEPALPDRIDKRTCWHVRRRSGPEAQAGVFDQRPVVGVGVAVVSFANFAVHLHTSDGHRQTIITAGK